MDRAKYKKGDIVGFYNNGEFYEGEIFSVRFPMLSGEYLYLMYVLRTSMAVVSRRESQITGLSDKWRYEADDAS